MIWVPGHKGIAGNETANLLAKWGAEISFIGFEPAWDIPGGAVRGASRDCMSRIHLEYWKWVNELRQVKLFISGPSLRKNRWLWSNRITIKICDLMGHCHLAGYLHKLELADNPICSKWHVMKPLCSYWATIKLLHDSGTVISECICWTLMVIIGPQSTNYCCLFKMQTADWISARGCTTDQYWVPCKGRWTASPLIIFYLSGI
jgi:hypothetical protein